MVAKRRAERPCDNNNPACTVVKLPGMYVGGRGGAVIVLVGSNVGRVDGVSDGHNVGKSLGCSVGCVLGVSVASVGSGDGS